MFYRNAHICLPKTTNKNVHSSFIHSSKKQATAQMLPTNRTGESNCGVFIQELLNSNKKNKVLLQTKIWRDLPDIVREFRYNRPFTV